MKSEQLSKNVDEYISGFPKETQVIPENIRATIRKAAPKAEETISYQIPAYKINRALVYFAAYENHIGFYPTSSRIATFKDELSIYKNSKGAVRFPLDKPLPLSLITKIVKFRAKEDSEKLLKKENK